MSVFKAPLTALYIGYFGRAPEPEGLAFWVEALEGGYPLVSVAQDFAGQAETLTEYPYLADPTAHDLEVFLTTVYDNLFNRAPDATGLAFWVEAIEGGLPLGTAILSIIEGAIGEDVATLQNKVDLACLWHDLAENEPDFELTEEAISSSRDALALVTADPESVAAAASSTQVAETFFNDAPVLEVTPVLAALDEGTDTSARIKFADIVVTDDDLGTNVLGLSGDDAALFEITGSELFLRAGAVLDGAANAVLDVVVQVDDAAIGEGPDASASIGISVSAVNQAPELTLTPLLTSLAEDVDTSEQIKLADLVITDDGRGAQELALSGADAALFELDDLALYLKAGTELNFEAKAGFDVTVTLDDPSVGSSPDASLSFSLSVTDANEAPQLAVTPVLAALAEDADTSERIKIADIAVQDDALGSNDLSLTGADAALFEIDGMELFLKAGSVLDFESAPSLAVHVVLDDASVGGSPDAVQALALAITDSNEVPTLDLLPVVTELSEDADTSARIKLADITVQDDALGTNDLSLAGADAAFFEIDGMALFLRAGTALDFES